jgi:GDPmannose 4,6-dehydratase
MQKLGWSPSVTFEELVALMVEADLRALGLSSSYGQGFQLLDDNAYIRQSMGSMVD